MLGKFLVHTLSHCGDLNEELPRYRIIEGQAQFGMRRGAKMSLVGP
jgi:hypothetical protein